MARATLGKLCQISLLPLRTEQHNNASSEINTINLLNLNLMSPKTHVQYAITFQPFFLALKDFAFNCATHTHKSLGQGPRKYLPVLNATSFECDQF
jgi:hypothetical protein